MKTVAITRMPGEGNGIAKPALHHVSYKTSRLQQMIDWYEIVLGTKVLFQYPHGAWLSNDRANHRIALLAFPGYTDSPDKDRHTGLHHTAFEYGSFDNLMDTYTRLKAAGIRPGFCLDHGMTMSMYYFDPDQNGLELQVDTFGEWEKSSEWMRNSLQFQENPIGVFFDPDQLLAARDAGMNFEEIHRCALAGKFLPEPVPSIPIPETTPSLPTND